MSKVRLGVTSGMAGFYAVLYDNEGPIETGFGRFPTAREAYSEATEWGRMVNIPVDPLTEE